jgi:hypothetical protein
VHLALRPGGTRGVGRAVAPTFLQSRNDMWTSPVTFSYHIYYLASKLSKVVLSFFCLPAHAVVSRTTYTINDEQSWLSVLFGTHFRIEKETLVASVENMRNKHEQTKQEMLQLQEVTTRWTSKLYNFKLYKKQDSFVITIYTNLIIVFILLSSVCLSYHDSYELHFF